MVDKMRKIIKKEAGILRRLQIARDFWSMTGAVKK